MLGAVSSHGNTGNNRQGLFFIGGDHFKIPTFKIIAGFSPTMVLVGMPGGMETVQKIGHEKKDGVGKSKT
jgi:hypothetical protein